MRGRWLREPLVHFLALGALLFAVAHWRGGGGSGSNRIVITPGQIDALVATFARTWQRPPTEDELEGLVDEHVRDQLATREALALGFDRDDVVIGRRLRQKLEFLVEDSVDSSPVTDVELQAWLEQHPDQFRIEPELAFRQVYLSPDRRGEAIDRDARLLLARLSASGIDASAAAGDSLLLPRDVETSSRSSIARQFGEEFANAVLKLDPGRWAGPIPSGYGLHLVWVRERREGRLPPLDEVRPVVERELLAARRRQRIDEMYKELLSRYTVVVERRRELPPDAGTGAAAGQEGR